MRVTLDPHKIIDGPLNNPNLVWFPGRVADILHEAGGYGHQSGFCRACAVIYTAVNEAMGETREIEQLHSWEGPRGVPFPNLEEGESVDSIQRRRLDWWVSNWADSSSGEGLAQIVKACVYGLLKQKSAPWGRPVDGCHNCWSATLQIQAALNDDEAVAACVAHREENQ